MLTLHHLNHSRSQRILWLLEELEVEYKLERYERDPKTGLAPSELKAVHPLGRSPVVTTEHGTLAESAAITDYIVRHYAKDSFTPPAEESAYQQYLFWLHFAEGSLMPPRVAALVFSKAKEKMPTLIKPIGSRVLDGVIDAYYGPNLEQSLKYTESYLSKHKWFAGSVPTAADVQMLFPLETLVSMGQAKHYSAICEYVKRIQSRPAYQRALQKGGEYAYA